ncbi:pantothenate kinase [Halomicronema hongdechloris]|uniref:pantothenate kinase n=1 Tax=Halomicronema hongdechloris TaxID=1209493 RepID=UPI00211B45B8|nr:pantothenate kinase [Halomicronema hongdechloris]
MALVIGNTRLHWAAFHDEHWLGTWHTPHLQPAQVTQLLAQGLSPRSWSSLTTDPLPRPWPQQSSTSLWMAAVVEAQAHPWRAYGELHELSSQLVPSAPPSTQPVPLPGAYATLGVDRGLALVGAGQVYGWPVLVIDAGTALTFTAGADGRFVGGAILPGLTLQMQALASGTAALPGLSLPPRLPPRWAHSTADAIHSGILYGQLASLQAFIADWQHCYPGSHLILTGGDGKHLRQYLQQLQSPLASQLQWDAQVIFWGIRACRQQAVTDY